ncbi:beta-galactosidase [Opitutaceae bacterium EW11]|nr:beta-galactosidase [Opitutaceae bacterium EW11]
MASRFVFALTLLLTFAAAGLSVAAPPVPTKTRHRVQIGTKDFLVDGQPIQIRCGEVHFARVPREYWRQRLRLCRAMGLNAVCAYLFWNYHEPRPGEFHWSGERDAAEFCRIAQEEGLWVILRPGPYACAEWDMGGLPWWLLKTKGIQLRSRDPAFMEAARRWFHEVGRVLGPLQASSGGPIILVQVENEYGFFGNDAEYLGDLRRALLDAGFVVPLFTCNPAQHLNDAVHKDLFNVVNFSSDPEGAFTVLRGVQPSGPLMCGEFYPGWFDTWGQPHHSGATEPYLKDLETILDQGASFSLYLAHGGTTFGLWSGADRPFKPDTTSYDYGAPIGEAGGIGEKFARTRALIEKHLAPGESLPEPPPPLPAMEVAPFAAQETADLLDNLPEPIADEHPRTMEDYDQAQGALLYRTTLPAGREAVVRVSAVHDFAWAFLDGEPVGVLDRRQETTTLDLPRRPRAARLDLLVYAMGRVNFGKDLADRKGLHAPVTLQEIEAPPRELTRWQIFRLDFGARQMASLRWKPAASGGKAGSRTRSERPVARTHPAFWRAHFTAPTAADTFLDLSSWGFGVVWINGRCLGRFWNIGPTQTMYVPGPWLRKGANEVVVLDLLGPEKPELAGRLEPILDRLRPELDFSRPNGFGSFAPEAVSYVHQGEFAPGSTSQDFRFERAVTARQLCFESLSAFDGKPFAAAAELDVFDENGVTLPHTGWTVVCADSEELDRADGSAANAIDGGNATCWHTAWSKRQPEQPHRLVIDFGEPLTLGGFRYTPRQGDDSVSGRVKAFRVYVGDQLGKKG